MKLKSIRGAGVVLCLLVLVCSAGCPAAGAAGPKTYPEIVIDTYDPVDATDAASFSSYMELWSSDGKVRLALDDGDNGSSRPAGYYNQGAAYIDYKGGLTSGDYYIRITATPENVHDFFGYGIRVITAPLNNYVAWVFGSVNLADTDDSPFTGGTGVPASFQTMVLGDSSKDKLNRYINDGWVNWIKLTLP
jgi:hypothetical protein